MSTLEASLFPMSVIILLLAISLGVALCFLGAFIWAVKSGQYDDDEGPSIRMLFDDEVKAVGNKKK